MGWDEMGWDGWMYGLYTVINGSICPLKYFFKNKGGGEKVVKNC